MEQQIPALGMIETWGVPALIAAADAAAKTADVRVTAYEKADAGIVTVYIIGDVASVKAAVEAGEAAARKVGKLLSAHVIPRPDSSIAQMIRMHVQQGEPVEPDRTEQQSGPAANEPLKELLPVQELRRLARKTSGFPLTGRQISIAGKAELLRLFMEMKD
jgi:microcompartment protein CcmL/EutN